jgi:hypothetical protein
MKSRFFFLLALVIVLCCNMPAAATGQSVPSPNSGNQTYSHRIPFVPGTDIPTVYLCGSHNISGTAPNASVSAVRAWVFGDHFMEATTIPVREDQNFTLSLTRDQTCSFLEGPANHIVFEYPSAGEEFNLTYNQTTGNLTSVTDTSQRVLFSAAEARNMSGTNGTRQLEQVLDLPTVGDRYSVVNLTGKIVWFAFEPLRKHYMGDTITVSGTTNLPVGTQLYVEIEYSVYTSTKQPDAAFYPVVMPGVNGKNLWEFSVNCPEEADLFIFDISCVQYEECGGASNGTGISLSPRPAPTTSIPTTVVPVSPAQSVTPTPPPATTSPLPLILPLMALGLFGMLWIRYSRRKS